MSHLLDDLRERRSVRKYQTRLVPEELVRKVLEVAGWAPSAHNAQPWRFVVLADPQVKRLLSEVMAKAWAVDVAKDGVSVEPEIFKLRVERFADAPALVLACFSMDGMATFHDQRRQGLERDLALQSLAAAIENLLIGCTFVGFRGMLVLCAQFLQRNRSGSARDSLGC